MIVILALKLKHNTYNIKLLPLIPIKHNCEKDKKISDYFIQTKGSKKIKRNRDYFIQNIEFTTIILRNVTIKNVLRH